MKIGLYNLEPHIVNTAMMQVSQYHKQKGDTVCEYKPLYHNEYDKVYAFSIFDFTPKDYVRPDMTRGGTGFDIQSRLPSEIEECDYDWSLYPHCEYSILWFSRGCIRNCPFCVVRQKEGYIHPVEPKNLNPNGKWVRVQDNNFFANPNWRSAIDYLVELGQKVDLQGVDVRLFNREQGEALQKLKFKFPVKIGWDNPRQNIDDKIELMLEYLKPNQIECYILIGYWSTEQEDVYRIEHIWDNYQIHPFVMPYNKKSAYQRGIARWCNNKFVFKSCTWEMYKNTPYSETPISSRRKAREGSK